MSNKICPTCGQNYPDIKSIGKRIRFARKQNNLTLMQLEKKSRLSNSFISLLENGKRDPSVQTLVKLSRALGYSTCYLLSGKH